MSNALATITFSDGFKLYTQYQGSADVFYSALFDSAKEAWSYNRHNKDHWQILNRKEAMINPEPVIAHNDYGGGGNFKGTACRKTKQLDIDYPEGWFGDWP